MTTQAQQIFEYLLAVKNLTSPPVRKLQDMKKYIFSNHLPTGEGCYLFGTVKNPTAWLEVHKQSILPPPEPHPSLAGWLLTNYEDETEQVKVMDQKGNESFSESPARVRQYQYWSKKWTSWSTKTKHQKAVQKLYGELFSLAQQIERDGEQIEIAFGHGLLSWKHPRGEVYHPLFITRLELEFKAEEGVFYLFPTSQGTLLETEMLSGLDLPSESKLARLQTEVAEKQPNPLSKREMNSYYQKLMTLLDPPSQSETVSNHHSKPKILEKPVFFVRQKSSQLWKEELQTILSALRQGMEVPKTIQALYQIDGLEPSEQEIKEWEPVKRDLYFPLPANEEQKNIARRLADGYGLTVQGPPGTGKSHTIANLISHLLAHGKKVLVTSQKEPALRVLINKIPASIRHLCVSLLGRDSKSLEEIEQVIRSISNKMDSLDPEKLQKEVTRLEKELKETRKQISQLQTKLQKIAEYDTQEIMWDNEKYNPLEAARRLRDLAPTLGWIPDPIQVSPPISDQEMRQLWYMLEELPADTEQIVQLTWPEQVSLDPPEIFEKWVGTGQELEKQYQSSLTLLHRYSFPLNNEWLEKQYEALEPILYQQEILNTPHFQQILDDWLARGERQKMWKDLIVYAKDALQEISRIQNDIAEFYIELPDVSKHQLIHDLNQILERLNSHQKLSAFFLMTTGRKLRYLAEYPTIEGRPLQTVEDVQLVLNYVQLQEKKERLIRKWNATMKTVSGPTLSPDDHRYIAKADQELHFLEQVFELGDQLIELRSSFESATLPIYFVWNSLESLSELKEALLAMQDYVRYQSWKRTHEAKQQEFQKWVEHPKSHPICQRIYKAFMEQDLTAWTEVYEEIKALHQLMEQYEKWQKLIGKLESKAPLWARQLRKKMGNPGPYPLNWQAAWDWRRVHTVIEKLNSLSPEKLEAKLHKEKERERQLVEQIIAKAAWKEQLTQMTEEQRRALINWRYFIKKIGKGTGKFAHKYRQEAKREMKVCQTAIPVWIMPIDRVIENINIYNKKFDVIIVDESSQCDLFSLAALMRAEKAVIVGDDEQISPAVIGIDQAEIHSLIDQYLTKIPQATSLDLQTSLYDVATRIYPGKLMLREHFRCVPEIIQFSNDLSYENKIIPLRLPTEQERIEPALLAKKVDGKRHRSRKINEIEATAIIQDIQQIIANPTFANRTIGVISLLGYEQAEWIEQKLRETIGEEKMLQHQIICGDAYAFQGDERDIIFLSMVISPHVRFQPLVRKDLKQRFNVAASRARNQMRLYHSVDLHQLHPDDLRFRLLSYCQRPNQHHISQAYDTDRGKTAFEQDILHMLQQKGYRVRSQVQVGHYWIDLVVEGTKNRLAIDCVGDRWHHPDEWEENIAQQQVLERAGWTFWRIRGSSFYLNPEQTMKPLWKKLDEMGIQPQRELVSV